MLSVITDSSTNWNTAYSHVSNNGTDHSYINQSVTTSASPSFAGVTATNSADVTFAIGVVGDYFPRISFNRSGGTTKTDRDWRFLIATGGYFLIQDYTAVANRLLIELDGSTTVGGNVPTISDGVGLQIDGKILKIATSKTPASASATGNTGEICWDSSYIYVCTATDTWKRTLISTW